MTTVCWLLLLVTMMAGMVKAEIKMNPPTMTTMKSSESGTKY